MRMVAELGEKTVCAQRSFFPPIYFQDKMTDGELLCNYKKCRKILTGVAYITRCSHAFCEDDGIKQIENQHFEKKCPACQSPLVRNYDLVKVTLNPNDQFKSMVLAGLRPEVVMDIAMRAILFWSYQQHQEQLHQSLVSKSLKDIINQVKTDAEVESNYLKSEILNLKRKQEELEKELAKQHQKCNDLSEKVTLKTREIQKWQMMYESLKRKQLTTMVMNKENAFDPNPIALNVGPQTMDDLLPPRIQNFPGEQQKNINFPMGASGNGHRKTSKDNDKNPEFVFQPRGVYKCVSPKIFLENAGNFRPQRKYS